MPDTIDEHGIAVRVQFALMMTNIYSEVTRLIEESGIVKNSRFEFEEFIVVCALVSETFQGRGIKKTPLANSLRMPRTTLVRRIAQLKNLDVVVEDEDGYLWWKPNADTVALGNKLISASRAIHTRLAVALAEIDRTMMAQPEVTPVPEDALLVK